LDRILQDCSSRISLHWIIRKTSFSKRILFAEKSSLDIFKDDYNTLLSNDPRICFTNWKICN